MALSGIQIYKLLPQTNCKECGFPTCLAFAMKLAGQQADLAACPYVSEDSKKQLESASQPPIRLITLNGNGKEAKAGNETVMFRHEKRFFNKPGLFIRLFDDTPLDELRIQAKQIAEYAVEYVGLNLSVDGFAIQSTSDGPTFAGAVKAVMDVAPRPLILMAGDPEVMAAGLKSMEGAKATPLIYGATAENWEPYAALAKQYKTAMAIRDGHLDVLAALTTKAKAAGVEDLVLDHGARSLGTSVSRQTHLRRMALKKTYRPLGYPIISFPYESVEDASLAPMATALDIAKYAGFIVLDEFSPATLYPLLALRENIYTDPQTPIQVQPGLYEIGQPDANSPLYVTTNFSITYFSLANEISGSGVPGWLIVADAEGMSVLTAWAAGKFDAERIAKAVKAAGVGDKLSHKKLVIPGAVAVLLGEVEEELPGWKILVGPREAVDIPGYVKLWPTL